MPVLVAYVSAHGFGHWAQTAPVLKILQQSRPDIRLVLRSTLSEEVISSFDGIDFEYMRAPVDVGMKQKDALNEDIQATAKAVKHFHADWQQKVSKEAAMLKDVKAELVLSNISPLAFAAANRAGIFSIGMGCLDWHEIYKDFLDEKISCMQEIREAYERCDILLKLPLGMPTPLFENQININPVKSKSRFGRDKVRRRIDIPKGAKVALVLFGGVSMPEFEIRALRDIGDWIFLFPQSRLPGTSLPDNVRGFSEAQCSIIDAIASASVVVGKPGYGLLAEVWAARRPFVFVPREDFSEYHYQRNWLLQYAPASELQRQEFFSGEWRNALEDAVSSPRTYPEFPANGAVETAKLISDHVSCQAEVSNEACEC